MDITNAFIHNCIKDEEDMAITNIRGFLVYILLEIAPDVYGLYVITDLKGAKKTIIQCQNTIYGTIMESLRYYKNFRRIIEYEGYEFNPYGPCVANKIIKGIQINVCFHLDYIKLSHKRPKVVGKTIKRLK